MDEDRSATTHDPAARLGRGTDVPDGIEHLGAEQGAGPLATARPATAAWPARWGGDEPGAEDEVAPGAGAETPGGSPGDPGERRGGEGRGGDGRHVESGDQGDRGTARNGRERGTGTDDDSDGDDRGHRSDHDADDHDGRDRSTGGDSDIDGGDHGDHDSRDRSTGGDSDIDGGDHGDHDSRDRSTGRDHDHGDRDEDGGDGLADEHDPPPRWAARPELRITPRSAGKEDEEAPAPVATSGRRSTYWAVAVLVAFSVIAAVGLVRGGGTDEASTDDPAPATGDRSEASTGTEGPAGEGEGSATTATTAPAARPPEVGDCALVDASTPPAQYVQVACEDARATMQLTATVPSPAPPGSHCPVGTDSVTQVSDEPVSDEPAAGGATVAEFWCLRNVRPPHPGDPGGGSGELVVGDCLGVAPSSQSIEVPCDGSGLPPEFVVGWMPDGAGNCPAEADATINLQVPFPTKYCLRYA